MRNFKRFLSWVQCTPEMQFVGTVLAAFALAGALIAVAGCKPELVVPVKPGPAIVPPVPPAAPTATAADFVELEPVAGDDERTPARFFTGYKPAPRESAEYLRSLPAPELKDAAPHFFDARGPPAAASSDAREPVLLYRALYAAYKSKFGRDWRVGAQGIGDCVSWGWSHGVQILLAIDYVQGTSGDFDVVATEAMYGLARVEGAGRTRGGYSDGSYGAAAARAVTKFGVVFRRDYRSIASAECDLRAYSSSRAKAWGNFGCGGSGDNGRLDAEAKKHAVKQVALVTNFDEAAAAIANGYPVPVCSGQGFSSTRDSQGFCAPRGSWSHCMVFIGVRWDRPGLLCLNSWGPNWVRGPYWPDESAPVRRDPFEKIRAAGGDGAQLDPLFPLPPFNAGGPITGPTSHPDMPDGSFWVDARVATRMLSGRDSYAVSNLVGFPRQELRLVRGL